MFTMCIVQTWATTLPNTLFVLPALACVLFGAFGGQIPRATQVCERIQRNGEPGFAWLENMRTYGRMGDEKNDRDMKAMGGNPCLEQTLESFEMCCLVETFPDKHESLEDYLTTLRSERIYSC